MSAASRFQYQVRRTLHTTKEIFGDGNPITLLKRISAVARVFGPAMRGELMVGIAELDAVVIRSDGTRENLGVISRRKVSQHMVQQICGMLADPTTTDQKYVSFALYKFMGCGTGVAAEAANGADFILGTELTDQARATAVLTDVSTGTVGKLQAVGTYTFTGTRAVTEFGLFTGIDRNNTTVNGAQASNATPLLVASTAGFAGAANIFVQGQVIAYTSIDATHFIGCTQGNAVITLANAKGIAAAGMLDRKQFAVINVNNGDSIQFTYTLTVSPEA